MYTCIHIYHAIKKLSICLGLLQVSKSLNHWGFSAVKSQLFGMSKCPVPHRKPHGQCEPVATAQQSQHASSSCLELWIVAMKRDSLDHGGVDGVNPLVTPHEWRFSIGKSLISMVHFPASHAMFDYWKVVSSPLPPHLHQPEICGHAGGKAMTGDTWFLGLGI